MTVQRCSFAGRDQIYFLPNKHHSNPNVNRSPSPLLKEPRYLLRLWFGAVCGNLVWKSTGHAGTRRSRGETAPGRLVLTHHIGRCLQRISKHPAWPKGIFHDFHPHLPRPFKWTLILKASPNFRTLLFATVLDHKPLAWAWHPPGTSSSKPGVRQLFCKG